MEQRRNLCLVLPRWKAVPVMRPQEVKDQEKD
jgi:hypothetical protein